jgi:hypothetical protein
MPRTADEQKYWDEVSREVARECVRSNSFKGCAHMVRDFADELLTERRRSAEQDQVQP